MGKTPDRFPGPREEDEIQLSPGTISPTINGEFLYKTDSGFEFYNEGEVKQLGLSEVEHHTIDSIVHNVAEDSYTEIVYVSGKISSETVYVDDTKAVKIRETSITYDGTKISQTVTIQYDGTGSPEETYTEDYTYNTSDQIVLVNGVLT